MPVIDKALALLKTRDFVAVGSADRNGRPNCAPKLLLKIEGRSAYFIDYGIGRSYENLKVNPRVSLGLLDSDSLLGYRLNGTVEILESGPVYERCLREFSARQIELSVERVVKGVQAGLTHAGFEVDITDRVLVYVVKIEEGCEISPRGSIERE